MRSAAKTRLLEKYTIVDTRLPDEARQEIGRIFCPHFLAPSSDADFHAIHRSFRHNEISLNYVSYGSSVQIDPGHLKNFFLLQVPISGSGIVRCGNQAAQVEAQKTASVLSPTLPVRMHWNAGCDRIVLRIDKDAMLKRAEAIADRKVENVEFSTPIDLQGVPGRLLMDHLRLMIETVEAGGPPTGKYLSRLGEGMAELLLTTFRHSARGVLDQPAPAEAINVVSRAQDWVQANIENVFTAPDVARAAGTSLRSLQEGIRRHRGTTLTEMVETIRLEHFRAKLVSLVTRPPSPTQLSLLGLAILAVRRWPIGAVTAKRLTKPCAKIASSVGPRRISC